MDSTLAQQHGSSGLPTPAGESAQRLREGAKVSSNRDVAVVQADYLALANDLEQAQALTTTLEMQLSGKTNELAQFKLLWERTQNDLTKFAHDLEIMRKERHSLANEVQTAYAYQHKYERLKIAHEDLVTKVDLLETELIQVRAVHSQTCEELERERQKPCSGPAAATDPELREKLEDLRDQLDRVLGRPIGKTTVSSPRPAPRPVQDHIDIEFGT